VRRGLVVSVLTANQ